LTTDPVEQPDRSIEQRILDIVERTLACAADGERVELMRHVQPVLVAIAGAQPVVNVNRNENYSEEKTMTQGEDKPGTHGYGNQPNFQGAQIGKVHIGPSSGNDTIHVETQTIPPEMTDALASLRALLEGVEGEDAGTMSKDLDEVGGALDEAPKAKDKSWAKRGFDALRSFWRVAEKLPDLADKAQDLAERLGGFLGTHCGIPWLDTFR